MTESCASLKVMDIIRILAFSLYIFFLFSIGEGGLKHIFLKLDRYSAYFLMCMC